MTVYSLTAVGTYKRPDTPIGRLMTKHHGDAHDRHCWELFSSKENAIKKAQEHPDWYASGGRYSHVVIEAITLDDLQYDHSPTWIELRQFDVPILRKFHDPDDDQEKEWHQRFEGVILSETPKFAEGICGWGIG